MKNILVSACLLGEICRYDAKVENHILKDLPEEYNYIPYCPEVAGGLSTPRIGCEIQGTARNVFEGQDQVVGTDNQNYTQEFIKGAKMTLKKAKSLKVEVAILKENSPSCGSTYCYDGTFSKKLISGVGLTSYLLIQNNIKVFSEDSYKDYFSKK